MPVRFWVHRRDLAMQAVSGYSSWAATAGIVPLSSDQASASVPAYYNEIARQVSDSVMEVSMQTTEVFQSGEFQVVRLPKEFEFSSREVSVRKEGTAVILEPLPGESWPEGFFDAIVIEDPAFERPNQGELPPSPVIVANGQH